MAQFAFPPYTNPIPIYLVIYSARASQFTMFILSVIFKREINCSHILRAKVCHHHHHPLLYTIRCTYPDVYLIAWKAPLPHTALNFYFEYQRRCKYTLTHILTGKVCKCNIHQITNKSSMFFKCPALNFNLKFKFISRILAHIRARIINVYIIFATRAYVYKI